MQCHYLKFHQFSKSNYKNYSLCICAILKWNIANSWRVVQECGSPSDENDKSKTLCYCKYSTIKTPAKVMPRTYLIWILTVPHSFASYDMRGALETYSNYISPFCRLLRHTKGWLGPSIVTQIPRGLNWIEEVQTHIKFPF
jgi:hypothetical protein